MQTVKETNFWNVHSEKLKIGAHKSGGFGDIITCAPIAKKYYDMGYVVYWPVREMFLNLIDRFDYVNPIILNENVLFIIIL